jgi:type IV pilus assembly protein PilA
MKKNKAFTLIELLAIIVILAIIAVITVPIILNVIENSKKGAAKDSALGFKDAVQKLYVSQLSENSDLKLNGNYIVSDGILTGNFGGANTESKSITVSGTVPSSGSLTYKNNLLTGGCIVIGDYAVSFGIDGGISDTKKGNCDDYVINSGNEPTEPSVPEPVSFATDSWETIKKAINEDNTDLYNIGDTKEVEIDLNGDGEINETESFTVRLSNKTFEGCDTEENGFSQTACGFVFEFIDTIGDNHYMNNSSTNNGGWPNSGIYPYLNDDDSTNDIVSVYEKLPSNLKNVISDTYTVSGHGQYNSNNFISTNKLYLLSLQEVFGNNSAYDTASSNTKQLEYYGIQNSTKIKKTTSDVSNSWWLRAANSYWSHAFFYVGSTGSSESSSATNLNGIAPAFRIVKD